MLLPSSPARAIFGVMRMADKKRQAKSLYISTDMLKKDIALQAGVTTKTLRAWAETENWDQIKESKTITRQQLLQEAYEQLAAVNKVIMEQHNGVPDKKLSDAKAVLRKEIEALAELPLHQLVSVFHEYTGWLNTYKPDKLLEYTESLNEFIEHQVASK